MIPAVVLELVIHIIPSAVGVYSSLLQLDRTYISEWVSAPFIGLQNFSVTLDFSSSVGASLLHSFGVTVLYTVLVVAGAWALGFAAALVVDRQVRARGTLRTIFLVPYAIPAYAGIIVWNFMFQRDNGMINTLLVDTLHILPENPFWLLGGKAFVAALIVEIWRLWPFAFLMTMAGMQSIPRETYEAAAMDGAGSWKQAWYVTLGMLRPVTTVVVVMMALWTFNGFTTPFVLFGSAVPEEVNLLSIHIYRNSFIAYNFGLGAAMSVLMLAFLVVASSIWLHLNGRRDRDS